MQAPEGDRPMCLGGVGKPIHEIMHALGVFHEQGRADRDEYVTIEENNIIPGNTQSVVNTWH